MLVSVSRRVVFCMRTFVPALRLVVALLVCSLNAIHLGQQFDPRERIVEPDRVHLSQRTMRNLLKNQVVPDYPKGAKRKGIQGTVVLFLAVDEKGRVSTTKVISCHPVLTASALQAAKRLRFRPYYLYDKTVESEGQISYLFTCSRKGAVHVSLAPIR
jgi:TonB family protein